MLTCLSGRTKPSQDEWELRQFIRLLQNAGVRRYCEIGARHGDTFVEILRALPRGSFGLAVDLPGAAWGQDGTDAYLARACDTLKAEGYDARMLLADSHTRETEDMIYGFAHFDAVLIDGDHTYDGVRTDWHRYANLAPIVAFHDIVGEGQIEKRGGRPVEVPRLWAEIKASGLSYREFIAEGSKMGIGIVYPRAHPHEFDRRGTA